MKDYRLRRDSMFNSIEERNQEVCNLYQNNMLITHIAKQLHMGKNTVTKILKQYGVYKISKSKNHISKEKLERNIAVLELYEKRYTYREIEKILNIPDSTAQNIVKTYFTKKPIQYDKTFKTIEKRKYIFNLNYFEKIDTEDKAYFLGFLYADGCVSKDAVKLELKSYDKHILESFREKIGAKNKELKYRKSSDTYVIYFNSKKMIDDLKKLGCTPRKTSTLTFPTHEQVSDCLIHHFMRGYFDGDGCIYESSKKSGTNTFSVVGNINFVCDYKNTLFKKIGKKNDVRLYMHKKSVGISSLYVGGNLQIEKIYDFLYKNATLFLFRKKNKFEKILQGRLEPNTTEDSRL